MFAVTTITGRVGGVLADTLLATGHKVRAVVRDEAKGTPWLAKGCEVAVADLADSGPLAAALSGVEGAFLLLPPVYDAEPGFPEVLPRIAVIREALHRALPPKVVVLSTIGADAAQPNLLNVLRLLEEALADLPVAVTFLRAAWFMENAGWDLASARDRGVIDSYLQPLDRKLAMIATADVGRTAAELLLEDWSGHRVIELEAQHRVSPDQVAAAFAKALGREVEARLVPRERWEAIFREQGMRHPEMRMRMLDGFNEGWIDFRDPDAQRRKGRIGIGRGDCEDRRRGQAVGLDLLARSPKSGQKSLTV
ncbi:NmrA family transcriptional regulator [Mesorhizobium sp. M2D.F.Ca.ET.185.01.1.1]|uniref:NmrA family NAD(P)-binding protein n=1 Tax=unclassified Mesorhizobium TaxID=325217 RepID=UPI000FCCB32B|nr:MULTISPECIES: NmrA family NAD(P)-binding protein [unclassified Mesorhizobium]TGP77034.1 NmrA family transcriptional regulator [bacterium M00.F.Ca.ET.227.01.1.1]TGP84840.1 NmrA family transcriptional regulator [bacterium M00.F.Ca.ET.221.01.1.1]TGP88410.1 NmrA family transcriptional regulator [bacterium M00.F.Ca.ET.222.01.1.1]TGU03172.1 NmrA family transcriptional regulator [bacterium M00.F.Ca.ET.163.01.1.1]TGU30781.1 NmrA family transcriptional regulator [bacterium M00.F.Ca.ET.156.01.1.1]TG